MLFRYITLVLLISLFVSCKNDTDKRRNLSGPDKTEMADLNRYFVQKDRERIQNYIERKNLKMNETPTGLWYQVTNMGEGDFFKEKDKVIMNFVCSLLDGTICYSSDGLGPKEIILGRSEMEAGLNEGIRLLKPGSEAVFIIPPYLAYGLIGDRKKIPSRAILVYNIEILPEKE
jgi:FKBP-type peptidyl-prolyl cis-trans isomerase